MWGLLHDVFCCKQVDVVSIISKSFWKIKIGERFMKKWLWLAVVFVIILAGCGSKIEEPDKMETEIVPVQEAVEDEVPEIEVKLSFDERKIYIPQLEQDYEIWFFADSHIIVEDGSENGQIKDYAAERKLGFEYESNYSSDAIFSEFIDRANKQKPDLVLLGGDIIDFPSEANVAFLKSELARLEVPYMMTYGNHDWTFPWEYMTEVGKETYRPMLEELMTDDCLELEDLVVVAVDNSSNQLEAESLAVLEQACELNKPVILLSHVPLSTEELIARAKEDWNSPVTLGMQVHGGIAPNEASTKLWNMTHEDESVIKAVLAGHVHFAYEEMLSESTVEIITDAGFKGKVTKVFLQKNKEHQYFCDKFTLTVDDKQFDLKEIEPELSSVSELYPIAGEQLYILGRVDENSNLLMVYDFTEEEFVFAERGTTMCWVQDKFETVRYLKDNVVYDLEGNVIYQPDESNLISMIEYVVEDFKVTVVDANHENPQEIWIE